MKLFGLEIKKAGPGAEAPRRAIQRVTGTTFNLDSTNLSHLVEKGYRSNPDLFAVVNYILNKACRASFYLYEVKDVKAYNDYRLLKGEGLTQASLQQAMLVRKKALHETTHPVIDSLLEKPNPYQSFRDFVETSVAYKLLSGERFLQRIEGLHPVSRIYCLPPSEMEIRPGKTMLSIDGYYHRPTETTLKTDQIVFSRTFAPLTGNATDDMRGLSPLRVLATSIQKSNEGRLTAIKQYQNAGPPGILTMLDNDTEPLTVEQARSIEDDIYAKQSTLKGRGRMYVTNMKAEWVQLGLSPTDLGLLESGQYDLRDFCKVYGVDAKLFGDTSATTYNNVSEARKAAIVDAVIPAVTDLQDDLNKIIEPFNIKGKLYHIDGDVSGFPELAEDLNMLWQRLKEMPITPNQALEAMQYQPYDHPLMNVPWFGNGRLPIGEFEGYRGEPQNDGTYQ